MEGIIQAIVSGILIGGIYGLFSIGFSLAFGVMRLVNIAHGEMVMIGMYCGFAFFKLIGADPFFSAPFSISLLGALGIIIYITVFKRFVGKVLLQQLLVAVALSLILQVIAELIFTPDARAIQSAWGTRYVTLGPVFMGYTQITAFVLSIVAMLAVEAVLHGTRWGKFVRAVGDDFEAAELVGINSNLVNIGAFVLCTSLAGLTGSVLVSYYPVSPSMGFVLMPIALIATVLGGLGSVLGVFIGGLIIGVIQQVTSLIWTPALQDIPLYFIFILLLIFRPYGLFGRKAAE